MHTDGVQITRAHDVDKGVVIRGFGIGLSLGHQFPASIAVQGKHVGDARGFDAGKRAHAAQHFFEDGAPPGRFATIVEVDFQSVGMAGLESQIDVEHA